VRIGAPDGFGSHFLASRLVKFTERYPDVDLQLVATARLFSLSKREADIAISLSMPKEGRIVGRNCSITASDSTPRLPISTARPAF